MGALLRDIRFALRMLIRSPAYTLVALMTLALAIGANTAIFSAVNLVLLRPLPFPEADQLVIVMETKPGMERMAVPYANALDYRAQQTAFTGLSGYGLYAMTLTGKGDPEKLHIEMQSADFLRTMGISLTLGRGFLPEEDAPGGPRAVLLGHGLWTRRYGADPAVVGRKITLDGMEWTVVGVLSPDYRPFYMAEAFIPLGARADDPTFRDRAARPEIYLFGRMKPGVTLAQAQADLQAVGDALGERYPAEVGASRPMVLSMHSEMVGEHTSMLLMLLGAVVCVLLIAAANVANLTLERAMTRQREFGIRAALGAGRWQLIRQMLVESGLLALVGGGLGLLLALWGVDLITASLPGHPVFRMLGPIEVDGAVLAYTLVVALGTGLLFGLVPALVASRQDLAQVLKSADQHTSASSGHLRARGVLVVAEVALALMLTLGAALAVRSLGNMQRLDPGFSPQHVMVALATLTPERYPTAREIQGYWSQFRERVAALPGVESATVSTGLPFFTGAYDAFYPLGVPRVPENSGVALVFKVDDGFIETLRIPLLAGRTFGPQDVAGAPPVVIIDQKLAERLFPGEDAVGKRLQDNVSKQESVEIVGVVGHVRNDPFDAPERTPYQMYYSYRQLAAAQLQDSALGMTMMLVLRTTAAPEQIMPQVRAAGTAVDPLEPIYFQATATTFMEGSLAPRRFTTALLGIFGALALVLAVIGLYAVMANSVTQRTRELGVRMALGAPARAVVALVLRQGMLLVGIGLLIGLVGAVALTRVMTTTFADADGVIDPLMFVVVPLALALVGLLATYIPARRATRIDPMVALRHE